MVSRNSSILKRIHSFKAEQSGASIVLIAALMPILLGTVGLGVDGTRYIRAQTIVANAADQAALSAAAVDGADRKAAAERFFKAQVPAEWRDAVKVNNVSVNSSKPGDGPVKVSVKIDASVLTTFGAIIGVKELKIEHIAIATRHIPNLEAVLALSSSGTMCSSKTRKESPLAEVPGDTILSLSPLQECTPFNAMKKGVEEFVRLAKDNQGVTKFKVGLIPYNFKVKFPLGMPVPPSIANSEPDRSFYQANAAGLLGGAEPLAPMMPLTSDPTRMSAGVARLEMRTPDGPAWTRTDLPLQLAGMMLDPSQRHQFPGSDHVKPFNDPDVQKIIILMTDGSNLGCCFTNWAPGNFSHQYVYNYKPYNDETIRICNMLKKQGNVQIFSILFDVNENDPGGQIINNTMARCASGTYSDPGANEDNPSANLRCKNRQNCYNVTTADQVVRVYRDIAQNFYAPKLTK